MITAEQIRKFSSKASPEIVAAFVRDWRVAEMAGINTRKRVEWFFTQIGIETGGLRTLEESLYYKSVAQIRKTWPSRFPTDASARPYVKNPQALANKVYNGRMGNTTGSDDGWDFRGGGPIQTTGRAGYRKMGFENNPDDLRSPDHALSVAVREWTNRNCNRLADGDQKIGLRKAINGGTNGLEHSDAWQAAARRAFANFRPGGWTATPARTEPMITPATLPPPVPIAEPLKPVAPPIAAPPIAAPDPIAAPEPIEVPRPVTREAVIATPTLSTEPPDTVTDENNVALLQKLLREKGWTEVGQPATGGVGPYTRTAIRAFRAENGMPVSGHIDADLIAAVAAHPGRKISEMRTDATPADVRAVAPETRSNWLIKIAGYFGLGGGVGGTVMTKVGEQFEAVKPWAEWFKDLAGDVPWYGWAGAAAVVFVAVILISRQGEVAGEEAYRTGARR